MRLLFTSFLLFCICATIQAELPLFPVQQTTTLGIGNTYNKDTYLSPMADQGISLAIGSESLRRKKWCDNRMVQQHLFDLRVSLPVYGYTGMFNYNYLLHYSWEPYKGLFFLGGAGAGIETGGIFNKQNGNNPATFKLGVDLRLSAQVAYRFKLWTLPTLTLRVQTVFPVLGTFFCAPYGASYYELFMTNNHAKIMSFGSLGNYMNICTRVLIDINLPRGFLRLGYENRYLYQFANYTTTQMLTNAFVLGYGTSFIPLTRSSQKSISNSIINTY